MKKIYCVMMLVATMLLGVVSCNTPEPDKPTNEGITLTLSGGGENIKVAGADVEKDVVVTASKAAVAPIEVLLTMNNTTGDAVLANNTLTIEIGQTTAKTTIKFPNEKYPVDTKQKEIIVTGETSTKGVAFEADKNKTTYFPYGEGAEVLTPELTITSSSTNINTASQTSATLTFALSKKMEEDLTVTMITGTGEGVIDPTLVTWDKESFVIKAGELSLKATVSVERESEGKLPLSFSINTDKATLKTQSIELIFKVNTDPVKLCLPEFEYNNYTITKTFSIGDYTLAPEHTLDASGYGLVDMTAEVTAEVYEGDLASIICQNKNSGSNDKYGVVVFIDWDRDGKLVKSERLFYEAWTAGSKGQVSTVYSVNITAPEGTKSGKYYARLGNYFINDSTFGDGGCGRVESGDLIDVAINYHAEEGLLKASVAADGATNLTVSGTLTRNFVVRLNKNAESDVTVNIATSGGVATLSSSTITVPAGQNSATGTISFADTDYPSGSGQKTVTLTISASDVEIGASAVEYILSPLPASGVLDTYCSEVGNDGYSYASIGGIEIGSKTLPAANIGLYNEYKNLAHDAQYDVEISEGTQVKVIFKNKGAQGFCGLGDTFEAVVYADWNQDGDFADAGEKYTVPFSVTVGDGGTQDIIITLNNIPADARKRSTLRIVQHFLGTPTFDGCQKVESGNVYDVAYNLK